MSGYIINNTAIVINSIELTTMTVESDKFIAVNDDGQEVYGRVFAIYQCIGYNDPSRVTDIVVLKIYNILTTTDAMTARKLVKPTQTLALFYPTDCLHEVNFVPMDLDWFINQDITKRASYVDWETMKYTGKLLFIP